MCWIMWAIFKYFVENWKSYVSDKQRQPTDGISFPNYLTKHVERI